MLFFIKRNVVVAVVLTLPKNHCQTVLQMHTNISVVILTCKRMSILVLLVQGVNQKLHVPCSFPIIRSRMRNIKTTSPDAVTGSRLFQGLWIQSLETTQSPTLLA